MDERAERYRRHALAHKERLRAALGDARACQRRALADALRENAGTAFGREHGFARLGDDVEAFRRAVPIRDHAGLEPWLERAAAGEPGVLTAEDPVVFFESSGSTGTSKKIPITPSFVRRCFMPPFYAAWANLAEHYPEAVSRPDATLNLRHDPRRATAVTASGRPHLGASQVDFARSFGEELAAEPGSAGPWGELPDELHDCHEIERTYLRVRQAVEHDVRCVVGINPAMIAALADQLDRWTPSILRELRDGTLGGRRHGSPNPGRARELERLAAYFGRLEPRLVWPRMELLFCWNTGIASLTMPHLREAFGAARVMPAPVAASEGFVAVALDRHATAASITVASGFYEFAEADEPIRPDSGTLLFDELEAGREYQVVLTHLGGLYRYVVGDVLRVVDVVAGVPRVEYAGRSTPSSVAGERLREAHLVEALRAALASGGLAVRGATFHAVADGRPSRYEAAIAPLEVPSAGEVAALERALDDRLGAAGPGYAEARRLNRLGRPRVHVVERAAFLREWERRVLAGSRASQVKDRVLERDDDAWERLLAGGPGRS